MHVVLRNRLRGAGRPASSYRSAANAKKRLDEQLDRARRLFEFGEYDWKTFCARRDEINTQKRQLAEAATNPESIDLEWW